MKVAVGIIRTILGLILIYASVMFFLKKAPETESIGAFKAFQVGIIASSYLMPLVKGLELVCGLSFLTNKYVSLSSLIILPVTFNILMVNYFMIPKDLPIGLFIFFGNLFLIYSHWGNYKTVFTV